MTPMSVGTTVITAMQYLQLFNQNTLNICHNMLRHLPKNKSAFANVSRDFDIDRVSEIETFLLDQTEKLIDVSKSNSINPDFGIIMPRIELRSDTEKRFTALLSHFISYSKRHNRKVFDTLYVAYENGSMGVWEKDKIDSVGGKLKGSNPIKLHNFVKAVANASDPNNEMIFESPMGKEPSKDLPMAEEQEKLSMPLLKNGTIELDPEMSKEDFLELLAQLHIYAEALKYKENSLKLRQETLMSTYQGNPNGTLRDMIIGTNAMTMELKQEQMILNDAVKAISEYSQVQGYADAEPLINDIENVISTYTLMKDDKLNFIIQAEKLDAIENSQHEPEFELASGSKL